MGPVRLGLEAVQRRLGALFGGCVTTGGRSTARFHEVGPVPGAQVPITSGPVPVDLGMTTVVRRVLRRHGGGSEVAQGGRLVTRPRCPVPHIGGDVPGDRAVQDPVDVAIPIEAAAVPVVCCGVADVGSAVPAIGGGVTLVRDLVAIVRGLLSFVQPAHSLVVTAKPLAW